MFKIISVAAFSSILCVAACKSADKTAPPAKSEPAAPTAAATPAPVPVPAGVECAKEKDVRTIHVLSVGAKGCEVKYSKFGRTETPASSALGSDHCHKIKTMIRKNLETAGFKCG